MGLISGGGSLPSSVTVTGDWSSGPCVSEAERRAIERDVMLLRQRQVRARMLKRRALEVLARIGNPPPSRQHQREVLARAKAIVELSREEREEWHRQQRLKRWAIVKARAEEHLPLERRGGFDPAQSRDEGSSRS
jgi:hypothetical protein